MMDDSFVAVLMIVFGQFNEWFSIFLYKYEYM